MQARAVDRAISNYLSALLYNRLPAPYSIFSTHSAAVQTSVVQSSVVSFSKQRQPTFANKGQRLALPVHSLIALLITASPAPTTIAVAIAVLVALVLVLHHLGFGWGSRVFGWGSRVFGVRRARARARARARTRGRVS